MTNDFTLASDLKRNGKLEEAIDIYRQNIQKNPNFSWSHYFLGETLEQLGKLDEAVSAYSKSIELNPYSDSLHYKLGLALLKQGLVNDALLSIEKAFSLRALPLYKKKLAKLDPDRSINNASKAQNVNAVSEKRVEKPQTTSSKLQDGGSSVKKGDFTHVLCKSMPRSGHHLLERLVSAYYGKHYDYCVFYHQECCMQMPCSRPIKDGIKLFMQKSHDLDMEDGILNDFKFIVQYRHPIPRLFSDFELGKQDFMRNNRVDSISYEREKAIFNNYFKRYLDYYPKFYCKWVKPNFNKDNFLILKYEYLKKETANAIKDVVEFIGNEFNLDHYQKVSQEVLGVRIDFGIVKKYTEPVLKNNHFFDVELLKKYERDIFELCPGIEYESYHELTD